MLASQHFADRLMTAIDQKHSYVVVGLDPRLSALPSFLLQAHRINRSATASAVADALVQFNCAIIDTVASYAVAVKPQIAFYEQYGHKGIRAFEETVAYARSKGLLVIADVKRGDIGSTARAYANGYLGRVTISHENTEMPMYDVDAVTVTPYLGYDSVQPFVLNAAEFGKGVFVLVRTSNESAGDLQDQPVVTGRLYELVGQLVHKWGEGTQGQRGYRCVGAVVGATYPQEAARLRDIMPECFFLVPGYGAQGATAEDILPCFNPDGYGAIINAARSIIYAYRDPFWRERFCEETFDKAAAASALQMKENINTALRNQGLLPWPNASS